MKRKYGKAIAAALILTMLSGCGNGASPNPNEGAAQGEGAFGNGAENGAGGDAEGTENGAGGRAEGAENGAGGAESAVGGAAGQQASGDQGASSPDGGAGDGASQAQASGGKPAPKETGEPEVYNMEELYTQEEHILPLTDSAAAWGISYKIEKVEYTESFGNRNLEHLEDFLGEAEADSQGNLSGDFKYLFLTITFTNTTDEFREINRNDGGISVIGPSLNTLDWSGNVVYYDTYWEGGNPNQYHHWGLEPGESVTSEVGWMIEGAKRMTDLDETLAGRMGSAGPYELYYHVKQYDSDNEGSSFIDLGVKVE